MSPEVTSRQGSGPTAKPDLACDVLVLDADDFCGEPEPELQAATMNAATITDAITAADTLNV
jgi:hypothetical protein